MGKTDIKYDILINETAGTVQKIGRETLEDYLRQSMADRFNTLTFTSSKNMDSMLEKLIVNGSEGVLIGGGDGSVSLCGAKCMKVGIPFGILPLGTMNLMARDLGIPIDLEECLKAYRNVRKDIIDTGEVNGHPFFCNAIIGIVPEASIEREKARETPSLYSWASLTQTVMDELNGDDTKKFKAKIRGKSRSLSAKSFIISNNAYVKTPNSPEERLSRKSLKDGKLSVYMARPKNILESVKLLTKLVFGGWAKDQSIKSFHVGSLILEGHGDTLISIDGEPVHLNMPLEFKINPYHTKVLVPAEKEAA